MTVAPVLGLHITVVHYIPAAANPFFMDSDIFLLLEDVDVKAITDGPAPLIVTPIAPALSAFFFTLSNPGIRCFLAGSTMMSFMEPPIKRTSFFINTAVNADAFERF